MSADISILDESFNEVYALIQKGKRAFSRQANSILIETYWSIGRYLSEKIALEKWGKGTITTLSEWLSRKGVDARGFSPSNLWRMRQLYDLYSADERTALSSANLAPAVRVLPQTVEGVFKDSYLIDMDGCFWNGI
jgi:hypothetical protein